MKKSVFVRFDGVINYEAIEGEIWKKIDGHDVEVSNIGRARTMYRELSDREGRVRAFNACLLKPCDIKGYKKICVSIISDNGLRKRKQLSIHRLVALAFIPNPMGYDQVNHIDGNKGNNLVSNLEWCTNTMNRQHAFRTGLQSVLKGEASANSKITAENVLEIRELAKTMKHAEIAAIYGIHKSQISSIMTGRTWAHV